MPRVPLLPEARNLPNQVDILGPVSRTGAYRFQTAGALIEALHEVNAINRRVEEEERKVTAAHLLSKAKIVQNAAVEMSEQIEDPDTYVTTVDSVFSKTKKDLQDATKHDRRLNNMVMIGYDGQAAILSDDVFRRNSRLRANMVERKLNETVAFHAQDVALQPLSVRQDRALMIEEQLNADNYFRPQAQKMVRKFLAQADESRINALLHGHPSRPDFKDPGTALEELRFEHTPYLPPEKRDSLYKEANTILDKQEREGKKLNQDQVNAKRIEIQNQIFGVDKIPDDQVIANALDAVNKRLLDPKTDMDQVHQWLGQRRNGVAGSKGILNNFMNQLYAPSTGQMSVGKIAKFEKLLESTPMDPDDKAWAGARLFGMKNALTGLNMREFQLDIAEDNAVLTDTRNKYSTFMDKLPMGTLDKVDSLYRDYRIKGLSPKDAQKRVFEDIPPRDPKNPTKMRDITGDHPGAALGKKLIEKNQKAQ